MDRCHVASSQSSESAFSSQLTRVFISGAGFLADSYDLFIINICVDLMALVHYRQPPTQSVQATVKTTALLGAIVGQLGFGALADIIGRKKVFIVTCILVILGAIMSATVQDTESSTCGIYCQLAFWRFILGVGVGGEYPLSAAVTAEGCHPSQQCRQLAMVFSMQGLGTVLCSLVLIAVTGLMGDRYDAQWRVALSMGALPMVCAFYFRWKLHEQAWNNPTMQQVRVLRIVVSHIVVLNASISHFTVHCCSRIYKLAAALGCSDYC